MTLFFFTGECVIALKSRISEMPVSFDSELIHQGESTGRLWGKMHIRCQSYKREPRAVRAYGKLQYYRSLAHCRTLIGKI